MHLISEIDLKQIAMEELEKEIKQYNKYIKISRKPNKKENLGKIVCKQLDDYHKYTEIGRM